MHRVALGEASDTPIAAMQTYLEFAEECDRLAKETEVERHRIALKEMAEAWQKLAEELEEAEQR